MPWPWLVGRSIHGPTEDAIRTHIERQTPRAFGLVAVGQSAPLDLRILGFGLVDRSGACARTRNHRGAAHRTSRAARGDQGAIRRVGGLAPGKAWDFAPGKAWDFAPGKAWDFAQGRAPGKARDFAPGKAWDFAQAAMEFQGGGARQRKNAAPFAPGGLSRLGPLPG